IFSNPFYAGILEWEKKTYLGKHRPMVTLDEFERVQELLGRPGRPRRQKHEFAFTGMLRCGECGLSITASTVKNRFGTKYTYYHCTKKRLDHRCRQRYIPLKNLEHQFVQFLRETVIPQQIHQWALARLERTKEEKVLARETNRLSAERTLRDTDRQLENLTKLRVRELITDEEYLRQRATLERD